MPFDIKGFGMWVSSVVVSCATSIPLIIFSVRSWDSNCFLLARWGLITSVISFGLVLWYGPLLSFESKITLILRIATFLVSFGYNIAWSIYGGTIAFDAHKNLHCRYSDARPLWVLSVVILVFTWATIWYLLYGVKKTRKELLN